MPALYAIAEGSEPGDGTGRGHPAPTRSTQPGRPQRIWPRTSPPGKSPGPVFGGLTPSFVWTFT